MISNFKFQISNLAVWIALVFVLVGSPVYVYASEVISGYAWSSNYGWINFGCTNCNAQISNTGLTGWAWNENVGRILLNPNNGGVTNTVQGVLGGHAFAEGAGWINFSGVSISNSGAFKGQASSDNMGTINFNCDNCNVQSNWEPSGGSSSSGGARETPGVDEETPGVEEGAEPGEDEEPEEAEEVAEPDETDEEKPSIIDQITDAIIDFIPDFLKPKKQEKPEAVDIVPELAPVSFQGFWKYLDPEPINKFALAPLPKELAILKEKFPQIKKLFDTTGVEKITDVQKLKSSKISLPGLTETIAFSIPTITTGKLGQTKAVPLSQLTAPAKNKLPSEMVFVKAGGGLVDYNIALSLNDQGQTLQKITTTAGQTVQFIVKAEHPVKKITGYIIFKSRKPSEVSSNAILNNLSFSGVMENPELAMPAGLSNIISVEGVSSEEVGPPEPPLSGGETAVSSSGEVGPLLAPEIETRLVLAKFDYKDTGNGVYEANIQVPVVSGEYEVITVMEYQNLALPTKEIRLITVVDPEGYVFKKNGELETRIPGAIVYLYWLNPNTKQYQLWPAGEYQQENPQVTDASGTYSFLVPNGYYYLKVDTPGFLSYDGKPFQVTEGSGVHINIELKTAFWWLGMLSWQTILMLIMAGLLVYNFYRDKKREK